MNTEADDDTTGAPRLRSRSELLSELAGVEQELLEERETRVYLLKRVRELEKGLDPRRRVLVEAIRQIARENPDDPAKAAELMAQAAEAGSEGMDYPDWEQLRGRLEAVEDYVRAIVREVVDAEEANDWAGILSVCAAALHQLDMDEPADLRMKEHLAARLRHLDAEAP